jgi:TIR domain
MATKVFINYRRDDSIAAAGRLHDRLAQAFGRRHVFMDVDNIPAGVDFQAHLDARIADCDVVLVIIGPEWLNITDQKGHRRIDNAEDFVGAEIAAALERQIRVIPVLVDGAHMPPANELPERLRPLTRRNAVEVRNTQFGSDAERLIKKMRETLNNRAIRSSRVGFGVCSAILLVLTGQLLFGLPVSWWNSLTNQAQLRSSNGATHSENVSSKAENLPQPIAAGIGTQISRIRLRQAVLVRASDLDWDWIEKDPRDNKEAHFHFRQVSTAADELTLYDESRDMYARLNFADHRAYWRIGAQGQWKWNYDIVEVE